MGREPVIIRADMVLSLVNDKDPIKLAGLYEELITIQQERGDNSWKIAINGALALIVTSKIFPFANQELGIKEFVRNFLISIKSFENTRYADFYMYKFEVGYMSNTLQRRQELHALMKSIAPDYEIREILLSELSNATNACDVNAINRLISELVNYPDPNELKEGSYVMEEAFVASGEV